MSPSAVDFFVLLVQLSSRTATRSFSFSQSEIAISKLILSVGFNWFSCHYSDIVFEKDTFRSSQEYQPCQSDICCSSRLHWTRPRPPHQQATTLGGRPTTVLRTPPQTSFYGSAASKVRLMFICAILCVCRHLFIFMEAHVRVFCVLFSCTLMFCISVPPPFCPQFT